MTVRAFFLTVVIGLWPALVSQAQTLLPPPAAEPEATRPAKEDSPVQLRQMQEDVTVFRVLLHRSAVRYYNYPQKPSDLAHAPPSPEGVYLKGQGVVFTCGLPQPLTHPLKKGTAAQAENSPWDRARLELRGEKPVSETKPVEVKQSLSETLLSLLAENGHHFGKLAEQERVTIAITFRPGQDCTRCHEAVMERRAATGMMGNAGGIYGLEARQPVPASPTVPPRYTTGSAQTTPAIVAPPRDEEQIDIQIGDLATKQGRHKEAEEAYMRVIQRLSGKKDQVDIRRLVLLAEVSTKLAQCELSLGQGDKAKRALEMAQNYTDAAVKLSEKGGKEKTPPLPSQLILSATKTQLDQVASHKLSMEEFSKAVTIEYRTFDAPESKKEGTK
jgi:hypothetical protein